MTITFKFEDGKQLGAKFKFAMQRYAQRATRAAQAAAQRAADEIVSRGQADMAAGGNFKSSRWQSGLHAKISFQSANDINIRITHDVFYWKVFEFGAVIEGRPMLWIPLSFATDALGVRARDYPSQLFRVDRAGKAPLLMAGGGKGHQAEAKYFGKEQVTIPKKFHLREITKDVARELPQYYKEAFKNG